MPTTCAECRKGAARTLFALSAFVACLALSGCTVAPPAAPMATIDIPPTWAADVPTRTGGDTSLAQWWQNFDDPLLSDLVARALQANTSVKSAQAALRQARAQRDVSAAALKPALGGTATARRDLSAGNVTGNTFQAGFDASWELDIFGANRSALDASEANARASAASLGDVQVSVAAEVALAYITLRSAQTRLAIARSNLASQLETLQIAQWRRQAGLATSLETEQARTAAEQTRAVLPVLQTTIEQARHALAVLTGQPPAALATVLADEGPVPQADGKLALSIPAETLRQRADVRAAEWQVSAAVARVAQADAARLPNFQLGGSLGVYGRTLGALSSGSAAIGALLANVSVPLFDGGALVAQVDVQQGVLDQARVVYQAAVLTALKDVEDALVALRGNRERLQALQQAAEAAGLAALLAQNRYSSGLVDFQTVLDTQRTQLVTQESVASASADLGADHVRLYKALGGGWRPDGATPASRADDPALPHS